MSELFDGKLFCDNCKDPLLSDGKGGYVHVGDLEISRIKTHFMDRDLANTLYDKWLVNLEGFCPCCGENEKPFTKLPKEDFLLSISTEKGVQEFAEFIKDFLNDENDEDDEVCGIPGVDIDTLPPGQEKFN